MISILIIPYNTHKQRMRLMRAFKVSTCKVEVFDKYLYVEKAEKGVDGHNVRTA